MTEEKKEKKHIQLFSEIRIYEIERFICSRESLFVRSYQRSYSTKKDM